MCTTPVELIERLMQSVRHDGILVACKAAELRWPTFHAVLKARFAYDLSATDISQTKSDFLKPSVPTARRMLRFWLVRGAKKTDASHPIAAAHAIARTICYPNVRRMLHILADNIIGPQ